MPLDYKLDINDAIYGKADSFVKSKAFQYEEEYRVLYYPKLASSCRGKQEFRRSDEFYSNKQIDFRVMDGKLISYWKMPIDGCVTKIVLESKCDMNKKVASHFLRKNGFEDVEIERSNIAYR